MAILCFVCEKFFSTQSSLNRHRREVHNLKSFVLSYDTKASDYKNFVCEEHDCNSSFINGNNLRQHLYDIHKIQKNAVRDIDFPSIEEFQNWFKIEERNSGTNYYLLTTLQSRDEEKTSYFYCNRSGKLRSTEETLRKRSTKSQGSCKLNKYCTSQIILKKNTQTGKCTARYYYEHYGHECEVQHVRIHKIDRERIASKLMSGVSVSNILTMTRNNVETEDKLNRIDFLMRKDINNIKTAFDINISDGCRHKDDATSVQLFVTECLKSDFNPVVYYKFQGEACVNYNLEEKDFCIILMTECQIGMMKRFGTNIITIDGTHGLNSYNFEMTTIMIIDEYGEGFPAAFMYTNRKDTYIYEIFFREIKEKVGNLTARVFMSDIAPAFYNAWFKIMGPAEHQLLCAWHVDRCWRNNLLKISNKDQRQNIYKSLKYIQYILDENELDCELEKFIHNLKDPSLVEFKNYFLSNYACRKTLWAYAYRKQCNINTNMHLESMHRALKYFYFDGKKIKRLDKSIHMLLKFIKDKTVERLIKLTKGKTTGHLTKIHSNHRAAVCSTDYRLESDSIGEGIIKNVKTNERYLVKIHSETECCQIKCTFCHICIHSCSCSCIDFTIRTTLCKHVHFYILNRKLVESLPHFIDKEDKSVNDTNDVRTIAKSIRNKKLLDLKADIEEDALQLAAKIKSDKYSYEQINIISKHMNIIKSVETLLTEETEQPSKKLKQTEESQLEPANKNIKKQISFFSTKKKNKKCEQALRKPSYKESLVIKGLMNDHYY